MVPYDIQPDRMDFSAARPQETVVEACLIMQCTDRVVDMKLQHF